MGEIVNHMIDQAKGAEYKLAIAQIAYSISQKVCKDLEKENRELKQKLKETHGSCDKGARKARQV